MSESTRSQSDILVVGGGPAGIAAAVRAAQSGAKVGIVDDSPALGGQIWRGSNDRTFRQWLEKVSSPGIAVLSGLRVFDQPARGILLAEAANQVRELRYRVLILATGARERFLPFPGWTLPNVLGAGGLQAIVKCGLPIKGKRVVVGGTGPLLLAVAAYLREKGAVIPVICEQASLRALLGFTASLARRGGKLVQALRLRGRLAGVRFATDSWVIAAQGTEALQSVQIRRGAAIETIPCDYLACGFHLVPNTELPVLLGCELENGEVRVSDLQETSVAGVYCAGEPTGIGGVDLSLIEGEIAGLAAAGRERDARDLLRSRDRHRGFAQSLNQAFRLRPELRSLPSSDTIVCRCEDVVYSRLVSSGSWRTAKLQTRCGMGACQGRVCGTAAEFLFDWHVDSVRPPVFPARLASMAAAIQNEMDPSQKSGGSQ